MDLTKAIADNLRFLCVEVDAQLARLAKYIADPDPLGARNLVERAGYPDNLKQRIHASCLESLANCGDGCPEAQTLRSVEFVATELNHITVLCRGCIEQIRSMHNPRLQQGKAFSKMLERVRRGIALVEPAIQNSDTRKALKIARVEDRLDRDYRKQRKTTVAALKRRKRTEDLIQILFVAQDIRHMGDALLAISEAIISANLGQPVDLERYQSMTASVEKLGNGTDDAGLQFEPIAETRSGSAISGVSTGKPGSADYLAIFKDGVKRKVKEEREGVKNWHQIYPGLAPKILSYKKNGRSAALLIEHLPGFTFEQVLLNEPQELLDACLKRLGKTLRSVWRETRVEQPAEADFISQLSRRIRDVYKVHPEFRQGDSLICGSEVASFDTLLKRARAIERKLQAPFSVYIHGDFNLDNIIYDPVERRINFIDLHRSSYMDYVQDVSVFMVSNYRLQVFDRPLRRRIMQVALDFHRLAQGYAAKQGDGSFDLRLALGLARSFATSTRFILDKSLARDMFLRARYLLERVIAADPKKPQDFSLPVKEIFIA